MSGPIEIIADAVFDLPTDACGKLLDGVVGSLEPDRKRDAAWDALTASRDAEIESGAADDGVRSRFSPE
jgi:hypothetical protein